MKILMLTLVATASFNANAYECVVQSMKPKVFEEKSYKVGPGDSIQIKDLRVGTIQSDDSGKYRDAFWLNADVSCPETGKCSFVGRIRRTALEWVGGKEHYLGWGDGTLAVKVEQNFWAGESVKRVQDILMTNGEDNGILRVKCQ
ncbi:MAG: hypothetical protein AB7P04_04370 [Bacteriovoracia bacterium]